MTRTIEAPRRFHLVRLEDPTGVSGTGTVAEGAVWSSGAVALHWPGYPRSTSVWSGLDELLAAHGHDGLTEIKWLDGSEGRSPLAPPEQPSRDGRGWPLIGSRPPYDPRD
jgi:hypothetical protein